MFDFITLEMSLKPFKRTDDDYIRSVCRDVFSQWRPLLKNRKSISVLLWVGDGSEILDYGGDLDRAFEWAYFIGTANLPLAEPGDDPALSLHIKKQLYMENPPRMTYAILKRIVEIIKEEGRLAYPDAEIRVGETFDIGPEFAISDFKYNRHTEICSGTEMAEKIRFVDSTALLHSDTYAYAAYPQGIPEGLPFATFLGAQVKAFFADMGFDYIWLSNGLGFSANPWDLTGKIFDGEHFFAEKLKNTSEKVFAFWKLFREACPSVPIETRGTNNSSGIDYATDGVPLWDIYNADFNITPPPNSPWAALNGNYGLEIMGHMSRICALPEKDFLFRYYIHDPWWMNSPWYDRYDGQPSDIYLPMSVARVDKNGAVQSATRMNILSIDNSLGNFPDACVNEPIPHLLKAEKHRADALSFLLWLYPMKEYTTATSEGALSEMYYGDRFIMDAINCGFPLNTVVSTDVFEALSANVYENRILVSPVIENETVATLLSAFAARGGRILLYGTKDALSESRLQGKNVVKIDVAEDPSLMREALSRFGYDIRFVTKETCKKLPVLAVSRSNNGLFFSVHNADTTTDTYLKFPLGAPILLGGEAEIKKDVACYRFARAEHRECRVFACQDGGVISAHEQAPVSGKYRRRILLEGLKDATVYYFPEKYCEHFCAVTTNGPDSTPRLDESWMPIFDGVLGHGFKGEHKSGAMAFLMPFEKYL